MSGMKNLQIVWFKRDLLVHDHAALAAAAERGPVLPEFIVEPELWRQPDYAGRHWAFASECLAELREEIAALGQPLTVRVGKAIVVLAALLDNFLVQALWSAFAVLGANRISMERTSAEWRGAAAREL